MTVIRVPIALAILAFAFAAPLSPAQSQPGAQTLPFIEDDYPRALAQARERRLPIFIEAWAPW